LYSVIASVVGISFYRYFFAEPAANDNNILVFCYVFGTMLVSFFSGLFSALQNFRLPNIVLVSINVLFILCLILFREKPLLILHFFYFYFGAFALQGIFLAISFFIDYRKAETKAAENTIDTLVLVFKYSLMAVSANIIYFLLYRVDYWFVNKFCSLADLGNYIQASKLGQLFISIPSIVGASVFASVAAQTNANPAKNILKVSRTVFGLASVLMISLLCIGKWMFPFIFGGSYNKMYLAFLLLAPGIITICILYPINAYHSGIKKIGVNIAGSTLALMVTLIGDYIFIPKYGIIAAATISSFGYATYATYVINFFCKHNNIPVSSFFLIQKSDLAWLIKEKK
jgi:O-antigen/teichoic acid export membrane protein